MELKDIIARAHKAREYSYACNGRQYKLRLPSEHEARVAYLKFINLDSTDGRAGSWAQAQRYLLEHALIGWDGVVLTDLLPDAAAPLPVSFAPDIVPVVLDVLDNDAVALANDMSDRITERGKRVEGEVKN